MEKSTANLVKYNKVLALIHLIQAIVIAVISSDAAFSVTQAYQRFDPKTKSLEPAIRSLFEIRLDNLARGLNKTRWFEYAISASIMMVAISMLSGMEDLSSLIMVLL